MALNVNALTDYLIQTPELIREPVEGARTMALAGIDQREGIKNGERLVLHSTDVAFGLGTCNESSTTAHTHTELTLNLAKMSYYSEMCIEDYESKVHSTIMQAGLNYDQDSAEDFAEPYLDALFDEISFQYGKMFWQGNVASGSGNLANVDGIKTLLVNTAYSASTSSVAGSYATFNSASAITIVDDLMDNLDSAVKAKPLTLFISVGDFNKLKQAYRDSNSIAFNHNEADPYVIPSAPGYSNLRIFATEELEGSNFMCITQPFNLINGTDQLDDLRNVEFDYQLGKMREKVRFGIAPEVKFASKVGVFTY